VPVLKSTIHILLLLLLALAGFALWLRHNESRLIYFPERTLEANPRQAGLAYQDVWLHSKDNIKLHGWFMPSPQPSGLTLLLLHGNAGNISHRMDKYSVLLELGVNVFTFDYRGYGDSAGEPSEAGLYRDADAAYRYLTERRGVDPQRLLLYGESLGSAVAIDLASRLPSGGVILEEAFTSAADVAQHMYPFLPMRWLIRSKFDTLGKIALINAPLLILHSQDDELFPLSYAQHLFAAAKPPKQLVVLHGGHNDAFIVSAKQYRAALQSFFAERIAKSRKQ
jgi:fermentation-respiration switch protein FrsA (DUF1100 family)